MPANFCRSGQSSLFCEPVIKSVEKEEKSLGDNNGFIILSSSAKMAVHHPRVLTWVRIEPAWVFFHSSSSISFRTTRWGKVAHTSTNMGAVLSGWSEWYNEPLSSVHPTLIFQKPRFCANFFLWKDHPQLEILWGAQLHCSVNVNSS